MHKAPFSFIRWYASLELLSRVAWLTRDAVQTWLDEHLFGWSPNASSRSSSESSNTTPSDDGDEVHELGDYDNVLGYLEQCGAESVRLRSGERKGSYADLQRLRNGSCERLELIGATLPAAELAEQMWPDAETDGIQLRRRTEKQEDMNDCSGP